MIPLAAIEGNLIFLIVVFIALFIVGMSIQWWVDAAFSNWLYPPPP